MVKKMISEAEKQLRIENEELKSRLIEVEETLHAMRKGQVDAIVVEDIDGEVIYSLTSAETPYRIMIEMMNEGAATLSADGTILYCNRRFAELISVPHEHTIGANIGQFIAENERGKFEELLKAGLKDKCEGEICFTIPDKQVLCFHLSFSSLTPGSGGNVCIIASDITRLKKAEKKLTYSEEHFRTIYENAPVLIDAFDKDGRCTLWNKECEKTFGWTIEEINSSENPLSLFYPDSSVREQVMRTVTESPEKIFREWNPQAKDGTILTCMWANFSLPDGTIMNLGYDISERKKAEEALQSSKEKFRIVADYTYDWEIWEGSDKQIIYISPSCERISGYKPEEFLSDSLLIEKIIHPGDTKLMHNHFEKAHSSLRRHDVSELDFRIIKKDGSIADIGHLCLPVFDDKGNYLGRRISNREITERKQAEHKLRESEKRMKEAQHIALVGNWELNLDMNKLTWSDEIYHIFEIDPARFSATYETFMSKIHPEEREMVNTAFKNSIEKHKPAEIDHRLLMPDGRVKHVHEFYETFYDAGGRPLRSIGIVQDITWRKHTEILLNKKNEELIKLNADKDRFMSILAHDLKSPFNAILGFMELLTSEVRGYDIDTTERQLNIVNTSVKHVYCLLEDLLMWAKSQSGKLPFNPQDLIFKDVCEEILSDMKLIADTKNITINNSASEDLSIFADSDMLKTILRNLVSNAIKFSNPGGVIEIKTMQKHSVVTVSVSDNGVGIATEIGEKLFDISQLHSTKGTANESGSGLGLFLIKEFVERHGGKIWVESSLQIGSTFYFTIPENIAQKGKAFTGNIDLKA